ncbi:MAG: hypothetical protein MR210_04270 [Erysipelotrichaceae bacterium]|nr:hypothetical protein [Erysipelotrichaceae bacterium]MDY5253020.1 hypothetical protein [Erysipelotrichaceae bacterium]
MNTKKLEILLMIIAVELALVLFGIFIMVQVYCWINGVTGPLGMPFFFG